jgi:uncharacterized protein
MNCPRCEGAVLDERDRDGVVVDICLTCRGVWLDRGELEKLTARASREYDEFATRREDPPPRGIRYRDDDDDRRGPRRKRGWFESLGDMFD